MVSEFQRVIQDIFIVKRQKPVFHIPGRIILRDPESHNTGEVSALFFLDRPESKLKHFVVALRVSSDLLRRIPTVIDMIFHDLLIVALRDLTENEPLRLTDRPGQSQMAPCDPLQKLFICILDICDQCVRTPFIFLPVFSP